MQFFNLSEACSEIRAHPGEVYVYVMHRPDGRPFYVGVGTGKRITYHERDAAKGALGRKCAIIRKIVRSGQSVQYLFAAWLEIWDAAAAEEKRLIALFGRHDLRQGPLSNRTDGGEGLVGLRRTEAHAEKISAALRGKPLSAEHRAKLAKAKLGHRMPQKTRAAMADWHVKNRGAYAEEKRELWRDPQFRSKMSIALRGVKRSEEFRQKNRLNQKIKFSDPEFLARWSEARNAGMQRAKLARSQARAEKSERQ